MTVHFTFGDGKFLIDQEDLGQIILEINANAAHFAHAEVQALMRTYKLGELTEEDRTNPYVGLLRIRLGISENSARAHITSGRLAHILCGDKKGYRVTEREVRRFLNEPVPAVPDDLSTMMEKHLGTPPLTASTTPSNPPRKAA